LEDRDSLIEKIKEMEKELVKLPIKTRHEIITEMFEAKMRMIGLESSKDNGYIPVSNTPLSWFLRKRGVSEDTVDAIIAGLQDESEENRMEIILTAMDSPEDLESWPWSLKMDRREWLLWLAGMLKKAKLPTEAINSIVFGLELNLEPAKREAMRWFSRLGIPKDAIDWLIAKMSASDDE